MYWFVHLGTITELNGWDAMNPGHLDQHLFPFYETGLADRTLDRENAKELIGCLWIKFNNHPAPPKVGVTAKESGTYNDFTNINLGGLKRDGSDGVNDVSYIMLEVIDELHLLQPQSNVQISEKTPDRFLKAACRVIRKGYGYPSVFNADEVVMEQVRVGKTLEDAREGGCSGCIETGAFGKEAYVLTGYLNVPKILELALNNGDRSCSPERKSGLKPEIPNGLMILMRFTTAFQQAAELYRRHQNPSQQLYRTHVCRSCPGTLSVRGHQRLYQKRKGLLQRRAALQHQLYPMLRYRYGDRQPVCDQNPCLRNRRPYPQSNC